MTFVIFYPKQHHDFCTEDKDNTEVAIKVLGLFTAGAKVWARSKTDYGGGLMLFHNKRCSYTYNQPHRHTPDKTANQRIVKESQRDQGARFKANTLLKASAFLIGACCRLLPDWGQQLSYTFCNRPFSTQTYFTPSNPLLEAQFICTGVASKTIDKAESLTHLK